MRILPLFSGMDGDGFEILMKHAYLQTLPAGTELLRQGEPADQLHIVVEGLVELHAHSHGREATIDVVRPVGTLVLAAVLKDAVSLTSARTLDRSRLLMIPAGQVRTAIEGDGAFVRAVAAELAARSRRNVQRHKDLKLRSSIERLAAKLLRLEAMQGGTGAVTLDIEKRTLASLLGMTPENLSRAFGVLKGHGVSVDGARIGLADPGALARFAGSDPLIDDPDI